MKNLPSSFFFFKGLTCHHFARSFHLFFIPPYNVSSGQVRKKNEVSKAAGKESLKKTPLGPIQRFLKWSLPD